MNDDSATILFGSFFIVIDVTDDTRYIEDYVSDEHGCLFMLRFKHHKNNVRIL